MGNQIYEKPVRLLMRDMAEAMPLKANDILTIQGAVDWFAENYPKIKRGTVTCHLTRLTTNDPNRLNFNPRPVEDDVFYRVSSGQYRLYSESIDPEPIVRKPAIGGGGESKCEDETEATQFALERDLRNYLEKNLGIIEAGLELYEEEEVRGVEFPVGGRFIDLLAVASNGDLVVIELKVARGYERAVGQLMRYMAWIRDNLAEPSQKVRGVIVARSISEDIVMAASWLPNVELLEYKMALTVSKVKAVVS